MMDQQISGDQEQCRPSHADETGQQHDSQLIVYTDCIGKGAGDEFFS